MLRLPVLGLPLELDIGLLRQHYTLLRKRSSVVAVARRQIRDGVDIGGSALHGERYTRFFWNVLVFMMGVLGSPKLYYPSLLSDWNYWKRDSWRGNDTPSRTRTPVVLRCSRMDRTGSLSRSLLLISSGA